MSFIGYIEDDFDLEEFKAAFEAERLSRVKPKNRFIYTLWQVIFYIVSLAAAYLAYGAGQRIIDMLRNP